MSSNINNMKAFYDSVFTKEGCGGWDDAPGKSVFIEALKAYLHNGDILPTAKIVEIGCGAGGLLSRIKEEVVPNEFDLYGVDFSDQAVFVCRNKHKYINVFCEDGSNTHFEDEQFDVGISYGAYEHFESPLRAIKELERILKYGGCFLCMLPTLGIYRDDRADEGWYEDLSPNLRIPNQLQWNYSRVTWESYFNKAGLALEHMDQPKRFRAEKPGVFYFGRKIK